MTAALELHNVWKIYPDGGAVLRELSLTLSPGEIALVTGENGAGKSTLLNITAGSQRADRGRICLRGQAVHRRPPEQRRRLGLHRMQQAPAAFESLSIRDNVLIGANPERFQPFAFSPPRTVFAEMWSGIRETLPSLFEACPFLASEHTEAGDLSFGQKRIVDFIGAVSSLGRDGVLLLDEPFAGIQTAVAELMWTIVREKSADGAAVLMVEHDPDNSRFAGVRRIQLHDGVVQ